MNNRLTHAALNHSVFKTTHFTPCVQTRLLELTCQAPRTGSIRQSNIELTLGRKVDQETEIKRQSLGSGKYKSPKVA